MYYIIYLCIYVILVFDTMSAHLCWLVTTQKIRVQPMCDQ